MSINQRVCYTVLWAVSGILLGISPVIILGCAASKQAVEYRTYTALAPDVQVLRLWEISKPEWPQIAHIRLLSKETHEQFHRDPVSFINRYQISLLR